jgi:undecaprenyl-diphosphatase
MDGAKENPTEVKTEWRYACLITASLLFGVLAAAVVLGLTDGLDATVRNTINSLATPELTQVFLALSFVGSLAFLLTMTALTAAVLWYLGRPRAALMLSAVFAVAIVLNNVVKLSVARLRPDAFFGTAPETYSFASGHALFSACYYGVMAGLIAAHVPQAWQRTATWITACAIIGGVGLSRIYLGVHYPTDVIAGFALAALIVCVVRSLAADGR